MYRASGSVRESAAARSSSTGGAGSSPASSRRSGEGSSPSASTSGSSSSAERAAGREPLVRGAGSLRVPRRPPGFGGGRPGGDFLRGLKEALLSLPAETRI